MIAHFGPLLPHLFLLLQHRLPIHWHPSIVVPYKHGSLKRPPMFLIN